MDGCRLIVDEDLVTPDAGDTGDAVLRAPATRLAEGLGKRIAANIVMLGYLCGATEVVSLDALREAVAASVPKGSEELNLQAVQVGYDAARAGAG